MGPPKTASTVTAASLFPLPVVVKHVLDAMRSAVVVFDPQLRVVYRNGAADKLLPQAGAILEVLGAAPDTSDLSSRLRDMMQTGCALRIGRMESGTEQIDVAVSPLGTDGDGHACGGIAVVESDGVAAHVAHELNNPIDGVQRYVNLVVRALGDHASPEVAGYLEQCRVGLQRMANIVRETLDRAGGDSTDCNPWASVNEIVEDAVRAFEERAVAAGIVVTASYRNEDMPQVAGTRLYQVCSNLIQNALEAMPSGGMLTVGTGVSEDCVVLRFEDTGSGLPKDAEQVFTPFYTTKRDSGGTGLGLAICRELLGQLGGTITAGHREGGGAVFSILIPLDRCAARREGTER